MSLSFNFTNVLLLLIKPKVNSSASRKLSSISKTIAGYHLAGNTLGRFRNSMKRKSIRQLIRKRPRPFEKSNNPSSRPITMRTFRSSRSCTPGIETKP